jgi:hypothetical protein
MLQIVRQNNNIASMCALPEKLHTFYLYKEEERMGEFISLCLVLKILSVVS